MAKLRREKNIF